MMLGASRIYWLVDTTLVNMTKSDESFNYVQYTNT